MVLSFSLAQVIDLNLEPALRALAHGAHLGRLGADDDVPAGTALPDLHLAASEDLLHLDALQQRTVTFLMAFLHGADIAKTIWPFHLHPS